MRHLERCGADHGEPATTLVSYLRGDTTLNTYYRKRTSVLGDIINASPLYVGKPVFKYNENNYQTYVTSKAGRQKIVLAAANDGMLHAFDRTTGNELWAFIPTSVMSNMYKLADTTMPTTTRTSSTVRRNRATSTWAAPGRPSWSAAWPRAAAATTRWTSRTPQRPSCSGSSATTTWA
jgi:hypothetical protein